MKHTLLIPIGLCFCFLAGVIMFLMLMGMASGVNREDDFNVFRKFMLLFVALFFGSLIGLIALNI